MRFKMFSGVHCFFIIMEALWNVPPGPGPSMQSFGKSFLAGITRSGNLDDITAAIIYMEDFLRIWFGNTLPNHRFYHLYLSHQKI